MSSSVIKSILPCIDSVLKIREDVGAVKRPVSIITREWSGRQVGDGFFEDQEELIRPQPGILDIGHDLRLVEGGTVKQGDLFVRGISKNRYPTEDLLDGSSENKAIEMLYKVGDYFYQVIHAKEKHLTWDVHIRRLSSQRDSNG